MNAPTRLPDDCRQARESLAAAAEGRLDSDARARLDAHLMNCSDCASLELEGAEAARTLSRAASLEPSERLLARLRRIPDESFACHRFAAAAAELLARREDGLDPVPSGRFAEHLATCAHCAAAWRTLSLAGTLPEIGPRRDHFRELASIPVEARKGGTSAPRRSASGWQRVAERFSSDLRWTVAAAYVAAMSVVWATGDPTAVARGAFGGAKSAATRVASNISAIPHLDRSGAEYEAARAVARGRALPAAWGKACLVAIRDRVVGLAGAAFTEKSKDTSGPGTSAPKSRPHDSSSTRNDRLTG